MSIAAEDCRSAVLSSDMHADTQCVLLRWYVKGLVQILVSYKGLHTSSVNEFAGNDNYAKCFDAPQPVGGPDALAGWADLKMLRIVNKPDIVPTVSHSTCPTLVRLSRVLDTPMSQILTASCIEPWHWTVTPS